MGPEPARGQRSSDVFLIIVHITQLGSTHLHSLGVKNRWMKDINDM